LPDALPSSGGPARARGLQAAPVRALHRRRAAVWQAAWAAPQAGLPAVVRVAPAQKPAAQPGQVARPGRAAPAARPTAAPRRSPPAATPGPRYIRRRRLV